MVSGHYTIHIVNQSKMVSGHHTTHIEQLCVKWLVVIIYYSLRNHVLNGQLLSYSTHCF